MKREPKDHIIFPLDLPNRGEALRFVDLLSEHVGLFKIGLELFISEGPSIVREIRQKGPAGIFLDLKLHDIPATVKRAFEAACRIGVDFVTIHSDAGTSALEAAAAAASGWKTKILVVTVLTSLDTDTLLKLGYRPELAKHTSDLVLRKATMARASGCHGVVCSGGELRLIRKNFGRELITVVPGIRPDWVKVAHDDQKRVSTPETAIKAGADYLVIGRPIRDARDPVEAAKRVALEISKGLDGPR